jgi:hypothetical protein
MIVRVFKVLILVILLVIWVRAGPRKGALPAEAILFATVPLGMLLLNDVSLTTHASVFLLPYAALLGGIAYRPEGRGTTTAGWAVPVTFGLCCLAAFSTLKELSVITLAILILFGACAVIVIPTRSGKEKLNSQPDAGLAVSDRPPGDG